MTTEVRPTPRAMTVRDTGPAPERQVALDLAKRGLLVLPALLLVGFLGWGASGAASVGYAVLLVVVNFLVAAALLGWAARISLGLLMGVSLFGFVFRLGAISAAVLLVSDQAWVEPAPLGITLVVTHLGLLFWETKFVSASLAFPGLKPASEER